MQIPETPEKTEQLNLMERLQAYASGKSTWKEKRQRPGEGERRACKVLHVGLVESVGKILAPLLDRVTSREMETFTLHDRVHGRKVAHLMWHILRTKSRERLTPPEIGMLVFAAHLHDLGMGLSRSQRQKRLEASSDLWDRLGVDSAVKRAIDSLRKASKAKSSSTQARRRAIGQLMQAEEVLLCQDTRERHATKARYEELIQEMREFHRKSPSKIPDIESVLSYDGDSFRERLIDVCVSHNEAADALVAPDAQNHQRPRFPRAFPVGGCNADLQMVAAALRLADILDFDRERTPTVLFHYLLPTSSPEQSISVLEWNKHLAISNWHIDPNAIVFRGNCTDHVVHHTIVQFCNDIEREIRDTLQTFSPLTDTASPFSLPARVQADIHEEGYHYVPYKFELDDERVYALLMGGAIYPNRLVALRELVQNAVDACRLRDSLTRLYEAIEPSNADRITIRYEEPVPNCPSPKLIVSDTGTGMDAWVIENCFLRVGRSYYETSEFMKYRVQLRKRGLDFAPVSEFGIGFLSCFSLADQVVVETALWESPRGDTLKRTLQIDGPTRLIRLQEQRNEGPARFKGTRVTLFVSRGSNSRKDSIAPAWCDIRRYILDVCQDLPYGLKLEHIDHRGIETEIVQRRPLTVTLAPELESAALRMKVADDQAGLEGEIVLVNPYVAEKKEKELASKISAVRRESGEDGGSTLIRGGFKVGRVAGLPSTFITANAAVARLRMTWNARPDRGYPRTDISRSRISDEGTLASDVTRIWLTYLLDNVGKLPEGQLFYLRSATELRSCHWLQQYEAMTLYRLGKLGWDFQLRYRGYSEAEISEWETGGKSLSLGVFSDELHWRILDLIMPKVARLEMGPEARFYLASPVAGFRESLEGWRTYISSPVSWGIFASFVGEISDLLTYEYPGAGYFNSKYRERLSSFKKGELPRLLGACHKLARARGSSERAVLSDEEIEIVEKAQRLYGGLEIGALRGSWRLDSFRLSEQAQLARE